MGKIKSVLIGAAALCCPFLAGTSSAVGDAVRLAAYYSTGAFTSVDVGNIHGDNANKGDTSEDNSGGTVSKPVITSTSTGNSSIISSPLTSTVTGSA